MIRLFIADDHPVVREGLKRLVADLGDMKVIGEAGCGEEVLAAIVDRRDIDVLVLDISMPGPGFLPTMRSIRDLRPELSVLVLSMHSEDLFAVRALKAGADGYLTKDHSPEELAEALRHIHGGGKFVTAGLAEKLALRLGRDGDGLPHERLSEREQQVLLRLAAGQLIKEIAVELELSPKTVSTYRARLLDKLDLKSTAELIRYSVEHGLASTFN
jgi:DNA-binding NarL/FixJ family response regulator